MATNEELQTLYQEIQENNRKMVALLKSEGAVTVEDHGLVAEDGKDVRLSDLFGDKDDLIVIHNMGASCPYCTLWADGFNGVVSHLEDRAAFVVVSPDDPAKQQAFKASRGWTFRMLSDRTRAFTEAMGFWGEHEGEPMAMPGVSTFRRGPGGTIVRVARSFFGPGDPYAGIWHLFDLLDGGAGDWMPKFDYPATLG